MWMRTTKVDNININSIGSASVFQIGDSQIIQCLTCALVVQREKELFFGNEGNLNSYPIFNRSIRDHPVHETISMKTTALTPIIQVGDVDVLAVSSSAVIHIGNSEQIRAESRIKHIRHLESGESTPSIR